MPLNCADFPVASQSEKSLLVVKSVFTRSVEKIWFILQKNICQMPLQLCRLLIGTDLGSGILIN